MNGTVATAGEVAALKDLIVRHKVCWEVVPIWHIPRPNERVKIGFEVDLLGTHDHPKQPPIAGCDECHIVVDDLRRIANAVMPPSDRASRYEIEPYDASISFSPRRHMRKDVTVAIDIVHRGPFNRDIDECEVHCLREIESALRGLGACPNSWSPPRAVTT